MPVLDALISAIRSAQVEVVDLTARLEAETPVIRLPEPFGNTKSFALHEISRYDERGPAWYWNDITTGEHTGTHFDAPVHWATGRDGEDISQVPVSKMIAPAAVLDFSAEAAADPDFLLEIDHVKAWEEATGPHTPGISVACAAWLAQESPVIGLGTETVGTDAGAAHSFDPPFPCHSSMLGAGKYGLTQLQNLERLPAQGALVITGPLPILRGSGSPCRALALVER